MSDHIKNHIKKHYNMIYNGELECNLNIPRGRHLAEDLYYPKKLFDIVPEAFWEAFYPCGNPLPFITPEPDDWILNLGSGISIDSLAIRFEYESSVNIINIDIIDTVLHQAKNLISDVCDCTTNLWWVCADGENLPVQKNSFDWIIMNGVFNLFPDRQALLKEIERTLKPNGRLVVADLCTDSVLDDFFAEELDAWAWCMSGAFTEGNIFEILKQAGFENIEFKNISHSHDFDKALCPTVFICEKTSLKDYNY